MSMFATERAPATTTHSVAARLDRIPPFSLHRRMCVAVGFANFFDLYDIFLGGVLAAVLAEQWALGTSGKALVISSGFAGMFFGASVLGTVADRLERRKGGRDRLLAQPPERGDPAVHQRRDARQPRRDGRVPRLGADHGARVRRRRRPGAAQHRPGGLLRRAASDPQRALRARAG
jgi:hypothetical protein